MPTIFDFDLTITIDHTFKLAANQESQSRDRGELDARINIKEGISELFQHDQEDISAIATFHNNPYYIAGYVSFLLKKPLQLSHITYLSDNPSVAIAHYKVEGSSLNFLISYINATGLEFSKAIANLGNKNTQIAFLRQTWLEQGMIERSDPIDFYDDDPKNYDAAAQLLYIDRYLVAPGKEHKVIYKHIEPDSPAGPFPKEIILENQLVVLRKKIALLKDNKHENAAVAAEKLYSSLFNAIDTYKWDDNYCLADFKKTCKTAIDQAHIELDQHRGWKNFLSNLALFIFGLGVGLIVKEIVNVVNNRPFLFFAKTESAQLLDDISGNVEGMRLEDVQYQA